MAIKTGFAIALLGAVFSTAACNKGAPASVALVGSVAPAVSVPDQTGQVVSLASFRGKNLVLLAFYPKDFTSG